MGLANNSTAEQSTTSWPGVSGTRCCTRCWLMGVLQPWAWGSEKVSDLVPMGAEMKEEVKGKEEMDRLYVFPQSFFCNLYTPVWDAFYDNFGLAGIFLRISPMNACCWCFGQWVVGDEGMQTVLWQMMTKDIIQHSPFFSWYFLII